MLEKFIKYIFPPKCIVCNVLLDFCTNSGICEVCMKEIGHINKIIYIEGSYFEKVICACEYSGKIKEVIKKYKFNNKPFYYKALAELLYKSIIDKMDYENFDIIMSVPLHKEREKIRGYNQSKLISKELSKKLSICEASQILKKTKNIFPQSLLKKDERHKNIKDTFEVNNKKVVQGKSVILVDDILTTGATLNEISKCLKECGIVRIVAIVVASGRK